MGYHYSFFVLALIFVVVSGVSLPIGGQYQPQLNLYSADESLLLVKQKRRQQEEQQDLSKIPGVPGVDYPVYHSVPETHFSCHNVPVHPGIYANVETGCQENDTYSADGGWIPTDSKSFSSRDSPLYFHSEQTLQQCPYILAVHFTRELTNEAYHVCHDGREGHQGSSFLCTNGTLFNQAEFTCDWWYNVNCHEAPNLYRLNADPLKNPYVPKAKPGDQQYQEYVKY